jgi:hypothetical protein
MGVKPPALWVNWYMTRGEQFVLTVADEIFYHLSIRRYLLCLSLAIKFDLRS